MRKCLDLGTSNDIKNLLHSNKQALHVGSGFEDTVKSGGMDFHAGFSSLFIIYFILLRLLLL